MHQILAFGASNSSRSINAQLARHSAQLMTNVSVTFIDLNDFEMPIFGIDYEDNHGVPEPARAFKALIEKADGVLISLAEHNGTYSVAFKNIMDWASRLEGSLWLDKPMCLMATSPGGRGGQSVLEAAYTRFPRMGGRVVSTFSLPHFETNYDSVKGITNPELHDALVGALAVLAQALQES